MTRTCLPPKRHNTAPAFRIPSGACDCHAHVFGPYAAYPLAEERSYTPPEQSAEDYIAFLDRLGLSRGVLVTASASGTDNRVVLDAIARYPERLRGVVVPDPQVSEAELDAWSAGGIRAVRANLFKKDGHAVYRNGVGLETLEALAPRLAARGWHAQIWIHAPDLPELAPRLLKLGMPLVIDHMGRMDAALGIENPGFQALCRLLAEGKAWTKISGADRLSATGAPYADVGPMAAAVIKANIENIVWGADWPHIAYFDKPVPDDGDLLNLLARWLPDANDRHKVLVANPARLYGWS